MVAESLAAGTRLVWVVNPTMQRVLIYRPAGSIEIRALGTRISGEDVLPGFECDVAAFFEEQRATGAFTPAPSFRTVRPP